MRNLKRALSLALASVMLMGMMVVGTGASYADVDSQDNLEAIEVLKAVGIMTGDEKGNFNPDQLVTRNEMAVVMANMLKLSVNDFAGTSNPFTDVPAWAQPYVTACYADGIIAGTSATTFGGSGNVTAAQAGLMLLKALGYFQYAEDFSDDWQLATIRQASEIELYDGVDAGRAEALTRNEVAKLVLNALTSDVVNFTGTVGTDIKTTDGTTIKVGFQSKYDSITRSGEGDKNYAGTGTGADGLGTQQLCEKLYSTDLKMTASTDDFGRDSHNWNWKSKTVGKYSSGGASVSYTASAKEKDIAEDVKDYDLTADGIEVYTNGKKDATTYATTDLTAAAIKAMTGNGKLVEIYTEDGDVTKVVVISSVLAKVTKVDTKAEKNTYTTVASEGTYAASSVTIVAEEGYGSFEKNDMVILTLSDSTNATVNAAAKVQNVYAAEKVTGKATSAKSDEVVVDGSTYKAASVIETAKKISASFGVSAKYDATLYLDQYGYVVSAKPGAASTSDKTFAVLKAYQTLNSDGELVYMANVADAEGIVKSVEVADSASDLVNKIAKWSEDDGVYTLTLSKFDATKVHEGAFVKNEHFSVDNATITKTAKKVQATHDTSTTKDYYFASDVQFVYVNDGKVTVESGVKAVTGKNITCVLGAEVDGTPVITTVYVLDKAPSSTTTSDDVIFVKGTSTGTVGKLDKDGKAVTYYTYDAYLNGEKIDDFYSTKSDMSTTGFFKYTVDSETGAYDLSDGNKFTDTTGKLAIVSEVAVSSTLGNLLSTSTSDYTAGDAVIVDITDNDVTSISAIKEQMDDSKTVKVMMIVNEETMVAEYIYVTSIA